MIAKALEVRDTNTFIPVLCVDMNPHNEGSIAQRYLLRRCGYACDYEPNIVMTRLDGSGEATNDPYAWGRSRTFPVAHDYIIKHWRDLKDGDVVDVESILGETTVRKRSERDTCPI